ncbi:hypothetical protein ES702_02640 [subsurface metagenome]
MAFPYTGHCCWSASRADFDFGDMSSEKARPHTLTGHDVDLSNLSRQDLLDLAKPAKEFEEVRKAMFITPFFSKSPKHTVPISPWTS